MGKAFDSLLVVQMGTLSLAYTAFSLENDHEQDCGVDRIPSCVSGSELHRKPSLFRRETGLQKTSNIWLFRPYCITVISVTPHTQYFIGIPNLYFPALAIVKWMITDFQSRRCTSSSPVQNNCSLALDI